MLITIRHLIGFSLYFLINGILINNIKLIKTSIPLQITVIVFTLLVYILICLKPLIRDFNKLSGTGITIIAYTITGIVWAVVILLYREGFGVGFLPDISQIFAAIHFVILVPCLVILIFTLLYRKISKWFNKNSTLPLE